jgi:hypothetical protein
LSFRVTSLSLAGRSAFRTSSNDFS